MKKSSRGQGGDGTTSTLNEESQFQNAVAKLNEFKQSKADTNI